MSTAACSHGSHRLCVARHTGAWSRHSWGICGLCQVKVSHPTLPPIRPPQAVLWQTGPCTPGCPRRSHFGRSACASSLRASSPQGQAFNARSLVYCSFHPWGPLLCRYAEQSKQSIAWHGASVCKHLFDRCWYDKHRVPPTGPSPPAADSHLAEAGCPKLCGICVGTLAVGGGRVRAEAPPLRGLSGLDQDTVGHLWTQPRDNHRMLSWGPGVLDPQPDKPPKARNTQKWLRLGQGLISGQSQTRRSWACQLPAIVGRPLTCLW